MPATVIVTRNGQSGVAAKVSAGHAATVESIYNMVHQRPSTGDSSHSGGSSDTAASHNNNDDLATMYRRRHSPATSVSTGGGQAHYRSVYADQARREYKKHVQRVGVIGPAEVKKELPQLFLKSHSAERAKIAVKPAQHAHQHASHAKSERLLLWQFNKEPATPISPPSRPKSGPRPAMVYRERPDYGKVPAYLQTRKQQLQQAATMAGLQKQHQHSQQSAGARGGAAPYTSTSAQPDFVPLAEEERVRVVEGLRAKWTVLMREYQHMSLVIDTVPKIHKKVALDKELNRIEQDIEKFSHPNIYISRQQ